MKYKRDFDRQNKLNTRMPRPIYLIPAKRIIDSSELLFTYLLNNSCITKDSIVVEEVDEKLSKLQGTTYSTFISTTLNFDKDSYLKKEYSTLDNTGVRVGKLLELFDILTSESCFKHINRPRNEVTIATASVSSIELFSNITINKPLIINTYLTSTGSSSAEIRVDLYSSQSCSDKDFYGSAFFNFVNRNHKDYSKAEKIPSLNSDLNLNDLIPLFSNSVPPSESDNAKKELENLNIRERLGELHKDLLKKDASSNLYKSSPLPEEIEVLHRIFLNQKSNNWNYLKDKVISIKDTCTEKVLLNYTEFANINGFVFGGHLMREGLELAYACLMLFDPLSIYKIECIDSITFSKSVLLSSISHYKAYVTYVEGNLVHIIVEIYNITKDSNSLTTTISVIFCTNKIVNPIQLVPNSYECGIRYLDGKRKINKLYDRI